MRCRAPRSSLNPAPETPNTNGRLGAPVIPKALGHRTTRQLWAVVTHRHEARRRARPGYAPGDHDHAQVVEW